MSCTITFEGTTLNLYRGTYPNGAIAILAMDEDGEEWGVLTVNLCSPMQGDRLCYLDVNNMPRELIQSLYDKGICRPTGLTGKSGYCEYPLVAITVQIPALE